MSNNPAMEERENIHAWRHALGEAGIEHDDSMGYYNDVSPRIRDLCAQMSEREHIYVEYLFHELIEGCELSTGQSCMYNGGGTMGPDCIVCSMFWYDSLYPLDPAPPATMMYRMSDLHGPGVIGEKEEWTPTKPRYTERSGYKR